ncbi:helix-turn-helix domain-containing protein [Desulfovibrio sp. OttesenSCG-928-G11]|nr:helix-turn-helix domain-containing protein [Desulfovibrio sp. OttesenSCG-928-G11]
METFGSRLKYARGRLSQAALAARLGIPQTTLSNYEKGRNEPNFATLAQLCFELRVNVEWLLFGSGPMVRDADPERPVPPAEDSAYTAVRLKKLEEQLARALAEKDEARDDALRAYKLAASATCPMASLLRNPEAFKEQYKALACLLREGQ